MDAATRAELAELRRRAFGLHPDIDADPVATARLVDLERLVLVEHAASYPAASGERSAPGAEMPGLSPSSGLSPSVDQPPSADAELEEGTALAAGADREVLATPPGRRLRPRRRDGWAVAAAAAVVAAAVVVATPATPPSGGSEVVVESASSAYSITRDLDARVLIDIPFGPWIDTSRSAEEVLWLFPTTDKIEWTVSLGEYYGWEIWIAGTDDEPEKQHCLLALRGEVARARCIPAALRAFSALVVTLPYRDIEAGERPPGFEPGERIGFWWRSGDAVTVLRAPATAND